MENLKVYLVEDDEIYATILAHKLKLFGNFFIATFGSGEEVLANLDPAPDIIILDYGLPGISGLETLHELNKRNLPSKVIFLSGHEEEELIVECLEAGAYEFLVKDQDVAKKVYSTVARIMEDNSKQKKKSGGLFGKWLGKLGD